MATLTGKTIANSYKDLLQVSNSNSGVDGTLRTVEDGEGTSSALQISSSGVKSTGSLVVTGSSTLGGATLSGDLIVNANIDLSGNIDVDGTLEADAITVNGASLASVIQGTTVTNATNATNVTTNANLTGHITSVGNAATLGSFTLAQLNNALSDATLGGSFTEVNDLSSNVTWANVPEANIPALATSKITSGTFDDARIASSNVTQHQASLSISASQVGSGTFNDARIAASNVTQHAVAKTGGTFSGDLKYDHQAYFPTGAAKILHRSQFFQVFHHHIKDSNLLVNTEYAIPWAGDATSNEGTGYSSSANPRSKYRFVVPYNVMKLIKIIVKPCNNTFTSYPATMTVNRYYKQGTDADTYNPNIGGPTTYAMNTTSNAPAGIGETPALVWDIDLDNNTNMSASQSHREGWEILLTLETNTTLTNGSNYGINVTTVWSCSY